MTAVWNAYGPTELRLAGQFSAGISATHPARGVPRRGHVPISLPRWRDFGLVTLRNKGRGREPMRSILAGQRPSAQVPGPRATIYGSAGL